MSSPTGFIPYDTQAVKYVTSIPSNPDSSIVYMLWDGVDASKAVRYEFSDGKLQGDGVVETTLANIGAVGGATKILVSDYKKQAKSDGRGFQHDLSLYVEYPSRISQAMRDVLYGNVAKKSIPFIGHSIVYGQNTGASEADYKTNALPQRIAARLNAYLGTTQADTGAIFCASQQQSLWTLAGGATYRTDIAGNNYNSIQLQAGNTASISVTGTSIVIYMLAAATGISVSYTIDGGGSVTAPVSVTNSTGDGVWHYYPVTITGLSAGAHTIVITGPATSKVMVVGIEGRSSSNGVVVHRAGNPSYVLPDMLAVSMDATDTAGNATWLAASSVNKVRQLGSLTTLFSPSLVMLMFDVNDLIRGWQTYGYTLSDCKRHLTNTLTALNTQGYSALVVIGPWLATASYAAGCPFTQEDLARVYREAVIASSNASLIDIKTPLYSRQGYNNLMMDGYTHPTALGANAIGQKIADAMIECANWF